jgi:inner membrane protein import complex subunit Tim44-like protein
VKGDRRRVRRWKSAAGGAVLLLAWGAASAARGSSWAQGGRVPAWVGIGLGIVAPIVFVITVIKFSLRRERARYRAVETAAAVAANDDPMFSADRIRGAAEELFRRAWGAWEARDARQLAEFMTPAAASQFSRGMGRREHHVSVVAVDGIDLVSLINREGEQDDRVTVRIRATMNSYVQVPPTESKRAGLQAPGYWTLAKRDGAWIVHRLESRNGGRYHLKEPIVTGAGNRATATP